MSFKKILAVSGKPGLYQLVNRTRSGFVVKSLIDGKVSSLTLSRNISFLAEIVMYTLEDEVPLRKVFQTIQEKQGEEPLSINTKGEKEELEGWFFDILPDYDEDRVYTSHIKKVIKWYNQLLEADISFEEESEEKE